MDMMSSMDALFRLWKEQGTDVNPPASSDAMARLATMLGDSLPPDLEAFYLRGDGMADDGMDAWHVSFWSIERVLREKDLVLRGEQRWWALGDVLINSWFFRVCPKEARTLVLAESTQEIFDSLEDFFRAYVDRPDSLGLFKP
jgi:hypothetical protein